MTIEVFLRPEAVSDDLEIQSFLSDLESIVLGGTATLRWVLRNADSASIDQGIGAIAQDDLASGSVEVTPTVTTIYTLSAVKDSETITATVTITVTASTDPTIDRFVSDDYSIQDGESATLEWATTNATSASINQGIGAVTVDGTEPVSPTQTTTYTLTAVGSGGTTVTRSLTIMVVDCSLPTINSFTADDSSIESGESTTIRWSTTDAASASINQGIGAVPVTGTRSVSPTATTTYRLTATNSCGNRTQTVTVTVTEPPEPTVSISSFSADDTSIDQGDSVLLSWASTGGNTALIAVRPTSGSAFTTVSVSTSGTRTFTPSESTEYQLQVWHSSDPDGTLQTETVTVSVSVPPPSIFTFTVTPNTIAQNFSVSIQWATTGASSVSIQTVAPDSFTFVTLLSNGSPNGNTSFTPDEAGAWTIRLRAFNSEGASVFSNIGLTVTIN